MSIHKLHWYLGYNSLAIMTEQERKHWLMKTDKKKTLIDPVTRDQYLGQIDNLGSDIIIETNKLSSSYQALNQLSFKENVNYILSVEPSAFTYCCQVNGFCFARITSTNYPTSLDVNDFSTDHTLNDETPNKKHYRFRFENCSIEIIPFGGSNTTSDVFATKWLRTSNVYLELLDEDLGTYNDRIQVKFDDSQERESFYYPLSESLQTLPLEYEGNGTYHTLGVTDDQYIGYPALWFTSKYTDVAESPRAYNYYALSTNGSQLFCCGNEGNASILNGKVYVGVDGNCDATPDDSPTSEVYVICHPSGDGKFTNTASDSNVPIKYNAIYMNEHQYDLFIRNPNSKLYMTPNDNWEYVDDETYRIKMSTFDQNCMSLGSNPLISVFDIAFDNTLKSWVDVTTDTGSVGIRMNSGNPVSDMYHEYPYHLNKWSGLPSSLQTIEDDATPEHMAIYAIHNTPNTIDELPETKQTAALLFDLGKEAARIYDHKEWYRGNSYEIPADASIPARYLSFVRDNSEDYYDERKDDLLFAIYKEEHPKTDDSQTDKEYETALKLTWANDKTTFAKKYPYTKWLLHEWLSVNDRTYAKYQTNPELFYLDEYVEEYGDITSDEEFSTAILHMLRKAITFWNEYDGEMYLKMDVIFGIVITDKENISQKLIDKAHAIECYTEDETFVCKIILQMYPTGRIRYFSMSYFGDDSENGVHLSDGQWHIKYTIEAADIGSGVHNRENYGLEFDMYVLSDIDDVARIYLLSNDDTTYVNNRTSSYPKPNRTLARICDIPTSIVQLTGISGIAPVSVVDPQYVRTEASYTIDDKDRLYNTLGTRWVRPTDDRIIGATQLSDNDYVFTRLDDLDTIDMNNEKFHKLENLSGKVDPRVVEAGAIIDGGINYKFGDFGFVYVGGFAFQYNVLTVDTNGSITEFSISAVKTGDDVNKVYPDIAITNFTFNNGIDGYTSTYGTSPTIGKGTGFRCTLFIPNVKQYQTQMGDLFDDLFALVRMNDGLWIYTYSTNNGWKQHFHLVEFDSTTDDTLFQTTSDAFMSSIIPTTRRMRCYQYANNTTPITNLLTLSTTSFVNIVDTTRIPIQFDIRNDSSWDDKTPVDLCKFACDGIKKYKAAKKTWVSAFETLKSSGVVQSDCYIVFKWQDEEVEDNVNFYAGIIKRSFNNVVSNDKFSMLPKNQLTYQNGINSNHSTTIVWDVPKIGPMMWVFNPKSQIHEKYRIDNDSQAFYIEREALTWDKIDIYSSNVAVTPSLFTEDDILDYDIYTNSMYQQGAADNTPDKPSYALPNFWKLVSRGTKKSNIEQYQNPIGNWTCVFPRVHSFVFENDASETKYTPIQLQMIHMNEFDHTAKIFNDATGLDESTRTLIIEDTSDDNIRLRAFNSETSTWETV